MFSLDRLVLESCHLYNGAHIASKVSGACYACHISSAEDAFATQLAISLLHQWFTFVHLSITYLPFKKRLFPVRSPPNFYKSSSAG